MSFLVKLLHFNKILIYFWLNHYLFGLAHTQKNLKDTMEGDDDYRQWKYCKNQCIYGWIEFQHTFEMILQYFFKMDKSH